MLPSPPRLLLLLLLAASCADETSAPDASAPTTARDQLIAGPQLLGLLADQAVISVDVGIRRSDGWDVYPTSLDLRSGSLTLSAGPDGTLQMTAASLAFEDIAVGDKGVPPTGLHLTDIEIHTLVTHECDWVTWAANGDACSASIPAAFVLDWSMVATDGDVHPLGTQELEPMDLWIDVARDDDGISAAMQAVEPGPLWSWAGIIEFGNLQLSVPAHEIAPALEDE